MSTDSKKVAWVSVVSAVLGATASLGVANLSGNFAIRGKSLDNQSAENLAELNNSYEFIKFALAEDDDSARAQRLKFMVDIGLLDNLNTEKIVEYAELEKERIVSGNSDASLLPTSTTVMSVDEKLDTRPIDSGFAVILESFGKNKIAAIKYTRKITGLGLKESKDLVERAGSIVVSGITDQNEALEIIDQYLEIGAIARIATIEPE